MTKSKPPKQSLNALLLNHPDLRGKLVEAIETDHFFITISCQLKRSPDDPHDLQHFYKPQNYPPQDVVNTLRHLARDYVAKVMPAAAPDNPGGGGMF